jgi:hypothetical protein
VKLASARPIGKGAARSVQASRRVRFAAAVIAAGLVSGASLARADVIIGQDWTPALNENGYTYFDGFTDYADGQPTVNLAQVTRNGGNWLQYNNTAGQYWGQLVGQMWANPNLSPANFNLNPRVEFDLDATETNWGRLMIRIDYSNSGGSGGDQTGSVTLDFSQLVARNKATLSSPANPFLQHISIDLSSFLPRDETATAADFALFLQPNFWGYWDNDLQQFVSANYSPQTYYIDNLRLTSDPVKTNAAWNVNDDGDWLTGQTSSGTATWAGGIPNGAGHTANFFAVTNYDSGQNDIGAHTVSVSGPVTIGVMNFNNANGYTIAGAGTVTVQGATGVAAAISTAAGNHTISTPLVFAGDTTVNNLAGGGLTVTNLQPTTGAITKTGPGAFTVNAVRAAGLAVNDGAVRIAENGGASGASRVGSLTIASGAKLDLADNDLIATSSSYNDIRGLIASARNGGSWDGSGLTSSTAASATPRNKTLGTLTGTQYLTLGATQFDGFDVTASDVLVKFTYYGDADLNGVVNFDDYSRIDSGFNSGGNSWFQGDFDYNSTVNFDDYSLIDAAFNTQSGTLIRAMRFLDGSDPNRDSMGSPSLRLVLQHFDQFGQPYAQGFLNAVPEPTSALALLLLGGAMRRRREDRSH